MTDIRQSALAARLPDLLPRALAWAEDLSRAILRSGEPLDARGVKIARAVGVAHPERIRVWTVPHVPAPQEPDLQQLALE
jgi:hypothetical protein